jgi:EmrB/QacA subfamily drug resistance transporter
VAGHAGCATSALRGHTAHGGRSAGNLATPESQLAAPCRSVSANAIVSNVNEPDPRRWRALWASQLAGFMSLLDVSIVNVALPAMQHGVGASPAEIQWVISGYALTFGLVLVAAGRLGDALGRKRIFLVALAGFVVTSALCGLAPNAELLVAARLAQGVTAGMFAPQNAGMVQDMFRGAERARAFGILGATVGVSTAVGPIIGGFILALADGEDGWRWVFLVNVPIGLLALVVAARVLPDSPGVDRGALREIDGAGAVLLGGGVLCVLLPLISGADADGWRLWWLFPLSVALFAAFARWEVVLSRRGRKPLLDPVLLRGTPGYPTGALIGLTYFVGFNGIWLALALFFQVGLGYTPLESGLAVTPFAIGSAVAAALSGRVVSRIGRPVTAYGLVAVVLGLVATAAVLALVPPSAAGWAAALPLLVAGAGGGAVVSPNFTLTLESVPARMTGAAGGALQTGQRIGAAVGTAVLAAVFYTVVGAGHGYPAAVAAALLTAAAFMVMSLVVSLVELRARRSWTPTPAEPVPATPG